MGTEGTVERRFSIPSSDGSTTLSGRMWLPPSGARPAAVVQLVHGMAEHIGRYGWLGRRLAERGFAAAGHDHLGHGESVSDPSAPERSWGVLPRGRGAEVLVDDAQRVRLMLDGEFPGVPHVVLGHSMGSFVARVLIGRHGEGLAGAVVSGTGWQAPAELALGRALTGVMGALGSWSFRSRFVDSLAVGGYGRVFKGEGGLAWLTRDAAEQQAYADDPACGYVFSVSGYHELFRLIGMAQDPGVASGMPAGLPVLLVSGQDDVVGGMGRAVPRVAAFMRSCGARDVEERLYPGGRHELLHDSMREHLVDQIVSWMGRKGIAAAGRGGADGD